MARAAALSSGQGDLKDQSVVVLCPNGPPVGLHDIFHDIQPKAAALAAPATSGLISPPELLKEVGELFLRYTLKHLKQLIVIKLVIAVVPCKTR